MKRRYTAENILPLLLALSIALPFLSCNSQNVDAGNNRLLQASDSITRDIPKFFQGEKWNEYFTDLQASLNLHSLRNGVKGWQVRLWIAHGVYDYKDSTQLIVLKNENEKIRGILYTYVTQNESPSGTSTIKTAGRFTSLLPKLGWGTLIDSLERLSVFELPDYTKIKGYHLATDSYGVTIEVAKGNIYRIYEYPDYEQHVDSLPEAQMILQILKLIENEFGIKIRY